MDQQSQKRTKITKAMTPEQVLQLDEAKKTLRFSANVEEFIELSDDAVAKLSRNAKMVYEIAREEWIDNKRSDVTPDEKEEEDEVLARIMGGMDQGRAQQRLEVRNEREGFIYRWIRPDMLNEYLSKNMGYKVVKSGPERTMCNGTGKGTHVIGQKGSEELILVHRTERLEKAAQAVKKEKNRKHIEAITRTSGDIL